MPEENPKAQWAPIDLNRGVTMRQDKESGTQVYMYKDDPGYYYSQFGKPLPEAMAEKVGFPVSQQRKERLRKERRAFATTEIDKELAMADKQKPRVVSTRGDFQVIDMGIGRANVVDLDGNIYNPQPLPLAAAERLLTAMAGQAEPLNPQEVLVARKKHDAVERVREGYDPVDVDAQIKEMVQGKPGPSVQRAGAEVFSTKDGTVPSERKLSEKEALSKPYVPVPSDAERAEKLRKAEEDSDPAEPAVVRDGVEIAHPDAQVQWTKPLDQPVGPRDPNAPTREPTSSRPQSQKTDSPKGQMNAPERSKPESPQGKVRSLG